MIRRAILLAHRLVFDGGSELSPSSVALLRRSLAVMAKAGIREVCVVDGERAEELREALVLAELPTLRVRVLANRSWKKASGSALLVARDFLAMGPCLVLRGDRPLEVDTVIALAQAELEAHEAAIVVADAPDTDVSDEVKVRLCGGDVRSIGLDLVPFDAIFTGHASVTPAIIELLAKIPNPELEDTLVELAVSRRIRALPGRLAWPWGIRRPTEVRENVAAILESKHHPRHTLLNPGPVNTTAGVKAALIHHDVCHRDSSFSELMVSLTGKLRRIFRATPHHTCVLVTGSGTAAMETAVASAVPRGGKILVIDNGAFGERLYEVARLHEMDIVHLRYAWGDLVKPADVARAFEEHPDIAVVAMCHHETSVGLLNPVREVGQLCRRHDALLIVDAVSSLGSEDIDVVRDHVDICYSSANKCLHAISGVGFLCVSPRTWQKIESIKPRSYYLDLKRYRRSMEELAQTPFTPAVSTYFALDAACAEFLTDGHAARWSMYRRRNRLLRDGLAELGMVPFTRTGKESHSVVTCAVPEGIAFHQLYDRLKAHGYIIYGCKDVLAERFLQVANMGDLDDGMIRRFLETVAAVLEELRVANGLIPALASPRWARATA